MDPITFIRFHDTGAGLRLSIETSLQEASVSDHNFDLSLLAGARRWPDPKPSLRARFGLMLRARRTRRLLGEMDDRMLADIGIGRGDAIVEAARPAWDLRPTRR